MHHLTDAWSRRERGNVVLVRYEDLVADLNGQMRLIGGRLGIGIPERVWPSLFEAATFRRMRAHAPRLVPDANGILKDAQAFFRRGSPGAAAEVLGAAELARYRDRAGRLAPGDLLEWLHGDGPIRSRG